MAEMHNTPKLAGPRMSLILPEEAMDTWLNEVVESEAEKEKILSPVIPYAEQELTPRAVGTIRESGL